MRTSVRVVGVLVLAGLAAAACGDDPVRPGDALAGREYDLVAVNGRDLPFAYSTSSFGVEQRIISGSIRFVAGGQLVDARSLQTFSRTGAPQPPWGDTAVHAYTRAGERVVIQRPMRYAPASYADTGYLAEEHLAVHVRFVAPGQPAELDFFYARRR